MISKSQQMQIITFLPLMFHQIEAITHHKKMVNTRAELTRHQINQFQLSNTIEHWIIAYQFELLFHVMSSYFVDNMIFKMD
jgi:hypothetical protein